MSVRSINLKECPVCGFGLGESTQRCGRCQFKEIYEANFLASADQKKYRQRLEDYRAAWRELERFITEHLRESGKEWDRGNNWNQLWSRVQAIAARIDFDEKKTYKLLRDQLSKEFTRARARGEGTTGEPPTKPADPPSNQPPDEPPDEPQVEPDIERVREWVATLPDGEVEISAWVDFLDTLDGSPDISFLKLIRDQEIIRQFNAFETVSIDAAANILDRRQKRVRQMIERLGDGVELVMLRIPGGEFQMGTDCYPEEKPVHPVRVAEFYLGKHAVTQAQWNAVARLPKIMTEMATGDSHFKGDNLPVECVSWVEAKEFCARLARETGKRYRLPTEAEWEYACRAGMPAPFAFGETITPIVVNYDGNYPFKNAPHGISPGKTLELTPSSVANSFGLCHMHGNVSEWCADEWHDNYLAAPADGAAWSNSDDAAYRVVRGGSWVHSAEVCRSSDRTRESAAADVKLYYLGFRVALSL